MSPQELKSVLRSGLLSFPLTDFDKNLEFNPKTYAERLEWLTPYGASALFAAGGTGEFFSLDGEEYKRIIKVATDTCRGTMPIIGTAGGNTRTAIQFAKTTEEAGAQGVLLLPHYLAEATQAGLIAHIDAICKSVKIGVVIYNRFPVKLTPETIQILCDRNPNLVGFKDSYGEIETFVRIRETIGDRLAYLGGLPTAETFAGAYKAMGCPVYSSAVFNFIPKTAIEFYNAHRDNDTETTSRIIRDFFIPFIEIRNREHGYAVSAIKAGATIIGHSAGPVRPPLSDLTEKDYADLEALIATLGPQ
jgi:5-dehydro-4-deoxyglucarate dehydratase